MYSVSTRSARFHVTFEYGIVVTRILQLACDLVWSEPLNDILVS